jgi:hypothetical protein
MGQRGKEHNLMSQYVHFSIFLITVPNLIIIGLMILAFAVGIFLSIPQREQ